MKRLLAVYHLSSLKKKASADKERRFEQLDSQQKSVRALQVIFILGPLGEIPIEESIDVFNELYPSMAISKKREKSFAREELTLEFSTGDQMREVLKALASQNECEEVHVFDSKSWARTLQTLSHIDDVHTLWDASAQRFAVEEKQSVLDKIFSRN